MIGIKDLNVFLSLYVQITVRTGALTAGPTSGQRRPDIANKNSTVRAYRSGHLMERLCCQINPNNGVSVNPTYGTGALRRVHRRCVELNSSSEHV